MILVGLDPSFTGFGVAIYDTSNKSIETYRFKTDYPVYKSLPSLLKASEDVTEQVLSVIKDLPSPVCVVEYPAMATRSGSYLATMQGVLFTKLKTCASEIIYLPPMAVNSFSGNKTHHKTYLVNYVKDSFPVLPKKRISHDEATAIILIMIYNSIIEGKYKNKWFKYGLSNG